MSLVFTPKSKLAYKYLVLRKKNLTRDQYKYFYKYMNVKNAEDRSIMETFVEHGYLESNLNIKLQDIFRKQLKGLKIKRLKNEVYQEKNRRNKAIRKEEEERRSRKEEENRMVRLEQRARKEEANRMVRLEQRARKEEEEENRKKRIEQRARKEEANRMVRLEQRARKEEANRITRLEQRARKEEEDKIIRKKIMDIKNEQHRKKTEEKNRRARKETEKSNYQSTIGEFNPKMMKAPKGPVIIATGPVYVDGDNNKYLKLRQSYTPQTVRTLLKNHKRVQEKSELLSLHLRTICTKYSTWSDLLNHEKMFKDSRSSFKTQFLKCKKKQQKNKQNEIEEKKTLQAVEKQMYDQIRNDLFKAQNTTGDGMCSLHALLGTNNKNKLICSNNMLQNVIDAVSSDTSLNYPKDELLNTMKQYKKDRKPITERTKWLDSYVLLIIGKLLKKDVVIFTLRNNSVHKININGKDTAVVLERVSNKINKSFTDKTIFIKFTPGVHFERLIRIQDKKKENFKLKKPISLADIGISKENNNFSFLSAPIFEATNNKLHFRLNQKNDVAISYQNLLSMTKTKEDKNKLKYRLFESLSVQRTNSSNAFFKEFENWYSTYNSARHLNRI